MKKRRGKRGESLAEAVIALAVITIVSATALTVIERVDEIEARTTNYAEARLLSTNLYDCYLFAEASDNQMYTNACKFILTGGTISQSDDSGDCVVTVSYTTYYYSLVVIANFTKHSFTATAKTVKGEKQFFELKEDNG